MSVDDEVARPRSQPDIARGIAFAIAYRGLIVGLVERRPLVSLFGFGALSVLAMAPFHLWPVLFFTLPALFWSLDRIADESAPSWRSAAWRGWAFGFGYHLAGLYWIGFAFLVQAERFAALMPFAILGLTAALGVFFALAAVIYVRVRPWLSTDMSRIIALALAVMVAEWLRGHILTGFPWNVLGYALTMPLPLMQWAGLIGIYGLTAVTVISLTTPLVMLAAGSTSTPKPTRPWAAILLATVAPLAFATLYGVWQLGLHPTTLDRSVRLRLVQPSFNQKDKFDVSKRGEIFQRHLALSGEPPEPGANGASVDRPTHIVWPEAAIPFFARRNPKALAGFDNALPDNVRVIAGTFRINVPPDVPNERIKAYRVFNTAMIFSGEGEVKSYYDKIHLVPFGEYLPARQILAAFGFENLTRSAGGLEPGTEPRQLMRIAGLPPVEMLICYEASFPGEVAQGPERPGIIINLTNDAWFGVTTGPYQHFHQTRLRAVEQGVAMLRSANTGISAIVDPMGRILSRLELNEIGVIDGALPRAIRAPVYALYGRLVELAMLLAMLTYLGVSAVIRRE